MKNQIGSLGMLLAVVGLLSACSGAVAKKDVWDMYALPTPGTAPLDNDLYYRAPTAGNDLAKRCNSIGDMPSCGSD